MVLFEKGNYAEARIYIDEALKNGSEQSDVIVEHSGDIYYMTGDVENALKFLEESIGNGQQVGCYNKKEN